MTSPAHSVRSDGGPRVALVFCTTIGKGAFWGFVLPALGLERIGAHVEDIASVELFDARFEPDLVEKVVGSNPDFVGINVKTTLYAYESYKVADAIRRRLPSAIVVCGGLHATSVPEEALEHADLVVRGDGELAFRRIVAGEDPSGIPNVVYRQNGRVRRNPPADPGNDLDGLRPPARHLRKPGYEYKASGLFGVDLVESSRGCTHCCSFCSPASVYPGKYRYHSPGYVFEEIRSVADTGAKLCWLSDDHFGGDLDRCEAICDLILASSVRMGFFAFIRPFAGRMDLKEKMTRAGFVILSYGAESSSEAQVKRYRKGFPWFPDFIARVNGEWLDAGACYVGNSYVFGDVDDDVQALAGLGQYARRLGATYIEPLYSQPYPGTRYREELAERDLLLDRDWASFTEGRMLVRHPQLSEEQLKDLRVKVWLDFYSPKKAAQQLRLPLFLLRHAGVGRLEVLRYTASGARSGLFGCLLEDQFYADRYVGMVETWFRETVRTFEPEEMDMADGDCSYLHLLGFGFVARIVRNLDVHVRVSEEGRLLALLAVSIKKAQFTSARVHIEDPRTGRRTLRIYVPLRLLKHALGSPRATVQVGAVLTIMSYNLFFAIPLGIIRGLLARNDD